MRYGDIGQKLVANLTGSPRSDRILLRNQLGLTYERASVKAKFAFLNVLPDDVLNMPEGVRKNALMNAFFFSACVYAVWHTEEFYVSEEKRKFEELLGRLYKDLDTDSGERRIEDLLNMHAGNPSFVKFLGNYVRQMKNNPETDHEIDEPRLAEDLIFWNSHRQTYVDKNGTEHATLSVQEKWANAIVKTARAKKEKS